jgi:GlpG protein
MRQVGKLSTEIEAQRFAAWLVSQRIDAHAEADGGQWAIWVRDEDQIETARQALIEFQANPKDPRYQGAQTAAESLRREEEKKRQKAQQNVVQMRNRWGTTRASRRCPVTAMLIAASVVVMLLTGAGREGAEILDKLLFTDPGAVQLPGGAIDVFSSIERGEVWRMITPIFVHFGMTHLVFNMLMLFSLGAEVEGRRGSMFLLLLVLALAICSNLGQAFELSLTNPRSQFGGMSGVVYGIFGYMLIKTKFDSQETYLLSPTTIWIMIVSFGLFIARDFPPFDQLLVGIIPKIANTAHAVGLFLGMAIAYVSLLLRERQA